MVLAQAWVSDYTVSIVLITYELANRLNHQPLLRPCCDIYFTVLIVAITMSLLCSNTGALLGGFYYDLYGAVPLFQMSAIVAAFSTLLSIAASRYCSTVIVHYRK